jgi:hypothetical protein
MTYVCICIYIIYVCDYKLNRKGRGGGLFDSRRYHHVIFVYLFEIEWWCLYLKLSGGAYLQLATRGVGPEQKTSDSPIITSGPGSKIQKSRGRKRRGVSTQAPGYGYRLFGGS